MKHFVLVILGVLSLVCISCNRAKSPEVDVTITDSIYMTVDSAGIDTVIVDVKDIAPDSI